MKKAAVVGNPVFHSKSPAIFSFLAKELGVTDLLYRPKEVQSAELPDFLKTMQQDSDWLGINVTIPHKAQILPLLDELSNEARQVGAVNVVAKDAQKKLVGYNTDVLGIRSTLAESGILSRLKGGNVLIYGSGGSARAVSFVLSEAGVQEAILYNQNLGSAEELARKFKFRAVDSLNWLQDLPFSLIVNCTPLGMKGVSYTSDGRSLEHFFSGLRTLRKADGASAFDLVYNPVHTPFLKFAEAAGFNPLGGMPMLVEQALATWEIWFGAITNRTQLSQSLLAHLLELQKNEGLRPIFLTGFMGVGKSLIGSILARELGWKFVDTDRMIEEQAKCSVAEIFSKNGENSFRDLEKQAIEQASTMPRTVVALGGGALVNSDNYERVCTHGSLIYLEAETDALVKRLEKTADSRPLLAGLDRDGRRCKILALMQQRVPIYSKAPLHIQTDNQTPEEVVREIIQKVNAVAA